MKLGAEIFQHKTRNAGNSRSIGQFRNAVMEDFSPKDMFH